MLVGSGERAGRRDDLQRRTIPAAERTGLREKRRRRADRGQGDGDPEQVPLEHHDHSSET